MDNKRRDTSGRWSSNLMTNDVYYGDMCHEEYADQLDCDEFTIFLYSCDTVTAAINKMVGVRKDQ